MSTTPNPNAVALGKLRRGVKEKPSALKKASSRRNLKLAWVAKRNGHKHAA